ncbi:MAG: regulatory protein RecX [Clostridiales bacterium]|nr:regulatory protein RecX [Clostridiales bacterium]
MYITRVENFGKSKIKIYIDEEYKFWLYSKEASKFSIDENKELTDAQYNELYVLNLTRAKKQVLNILKRMDKTEKEIITKLGQAGYTDVIISETLDYINSFNYIDDERYARQYVRYKRDSQSKREIMNGLLLKGVSKEIAIEAIEEEYESEETAILRAIKKRRRANEDLSDEDKRKLTANLYKKGFDLELIKRLLDYSDIDF